MLRLVYHGVRKAAGKTAGLLNGSDAAFERGQIFDRVRGELGEDECDELGRDSALVLDEIVYCQTKLSSVGKSLQAVRSAWVSNVNENEQKKSLINHDFLIFKLQPGIAHSPPIYIKAEKFGRGDNGSKAGIYITVISKGGEDTDKCELRRIECGTQIGLLDLTAILKKKSPHYDLESDNCWDYARKTTKMVLEECILRTSEGGEKKTRLQTELKNLESNLITQHAVNTGKKVWAFTKSHVLDKL